MIRFFEDHHDDWYLDLADRANSLFDDCQELKDELDDEDKELIEDARGPTIAFPHMISIKLQVCSNC